jgi:hypothetical protein
METLTVPTSIWINLVLLVAAALFVWWKLRTAAAAPRQGRPQSRPAQRATRAPADSAAPTTATPADL